MSDRVLGDLAELTVGHVGPMASEYVAHGIPFLRSLNVQPFRVDLSGVKFISPEFHAKLRKSTLRPGDVVVVRTGAPGTAAVVPDSLPLANCSDLVIVRPGPELDSRYLAYLINGVARGYIDSRTVGAVQQHFNVGAARGVPIPAASMEEQQRIASVLGALDDLIETNRLLGTSLANQITALFRGLETTHEQPFFDVFDVDFGAAFKGYHFGAPGVGLPLLRIRDLKTFRSDIWTTERIDGDVLIAPGDVVVGMDAEFRPTRWLGAPSLLNQRVCRVRAKRRSLAWAREALVGPLAYVEGHKAGTTVAHLNKRDIEELRIHVPDPEAGARFDCQAQPLYDAVVSLQYEVADLTRVRDELLPLLMSGNILVADVVAA